MKRLKRWKGLTMAKQPNTEFVKFTPLRDPKGVPVLPSKKNFFTPSRQSGLEKEVEKKMRSALTSAYRRIVDLVKKMPRVAVNAKRYEYLVDPDALTSILEDFSRILNSEILGSDRGDYVKNLFFMDRVIDRSYHAGARDAIESAKRVTPAATVGNELANRIMTIGTTEAMAMASISRRAAFVSARVFEEMKGLTDELRRSLSEVLTRSILSGQGIEETSKQIRATIGGKMKRAFVIARTEINNAYRDANATEMEALNNNIYDDSDWELQLLWFSALTSTTRREHARRHGKTYTKSEVDRFYSRDGNAINCYCNQQPVLVNKKTGEVIQYSLFKKMEAQRSEWEDAATKAEKKGERKAA